MGETPLNESGVADLFALTRSWHEYCLSFAWALAKEPENFRSITRVDASSHTLFTGAIAMELMLFLPFAAIEYSLLYMLGGGGIIGALVIFVIAKMLRR